MKPSTQYNDKIGHASADVAGIDYEAVAQRYNLGEKYTIIGIALYGVRNISVSFLCIDNEESTPENEVLVHVYPRKEIKISEVLERLSVTINITNNSKYDDRNLDTVREDSIDFDDIDEDENEDEDENDEE